MKRNLSKFVAGLCTAVLGVTNTIIPSAVSAINTESYNLKELHTSVKSVDYDSEEFKIKFKLFKENEDYDGAAGLFGLEPVSSTKYEHLYTDGTGYITIAFNDIDNDVDCNGVVFTLVKCFVRDLRLYSVSDYIDVDEALFVPGLEVMYGCFSYRVNDDLTLSVSAVDWRAFEKFQEHRWLIILDELYGHKVVSFEKSLNYSTYMNEVEIVCIQADIKEIPDNCFASMSNLSGVILDNPTSITRIGDNAFGNCPKFTGFYTCSYLGSIETVLSAKKPANDLLYSVESVGNKAFYNCSKLAYTYGSDKLKTIGDYAYSNCDIREVTLSDSVESIGKGAFEYCNIAKLKLSNSLKEIPEDCFKMQGNHNTPISLLTIPGNVTYIDAAAFSGCFINEIDLSDMGKNYDGTSFIGMYAFQDCKCTDRAIKFSFRKFNCSISAFANNNLGSWDKLYEIPKTMEFIGDKAFADNSMSGLIIPDTVKHIGIDVLGNNSNPLDRPILHIYNPECIIESQPDDTIIYGFEGSTAEKLAIKDKLEFHILEPQTVDNTLWGDANCDGYVNIADATAIVQHLGNKDKYGLSEQGLINADIVDTGNGVTGIDAVAIQLETAGVYTADALPFTSEEFEKILSSIN